MRANQAAVDALDDAAAANLGINRTDLRCIDVLLQEPDGSAIPARLAERLGISTGSVTALIDRLERLGYVARAAIRSFFIGVKCDTAVNRNMAASAARALSSHVANIPTPNRPLARKTSSDPKRMISISMMTEHSNVRPTATS